MIRNITPSRSTHDVEKQSLLGSHVVIEYDGKSWMSGLLDETPICELSIPGTHDSAAYTYAVPFIATQNLTITKQLDAGIRYLDLRCAIRNDVLEMVHGPQFLGLTLLDVFNTLYDWLEANASEGLIVQLKKDREDESSSLTFIQALVSLIEDRTDCWRTANSTPTVGQLRGHIQLLRRFRGGDLTGYGLNVSRWQDNPKKPFTMDVGHGIRVTVQDHYRYDEPLPLPLVVGEKHREVNDLLTRAAACEKPDHWFINFTSALELNWSYQYAPRKIAGGGYYGLKRVQGVNHLLKDGLLNLHEHSHLGVVAMDFPNLCSGLIEAVVNTNFAGRSSAETSRYIDLRSSMLFFVLCCCVLLYATQMSIAAGKRSLT